MIIALPAPEVDKASPCSMPTVKTRGKSVSSKPLFRTTRGYRIMNIVVLISGNEVIYRQLLTPVKPTKLKAPYGSFQQ